MQNPNQPTNVSAFKQWPFLRRAKKSWPLYPWLSERISKLVQTSEKRFATEIRSFVQPLRDSARLKEFGHQLISPDLSSSASTKSGLGEPKECSASYALKSPALWMLKK